MKRAHYAAGVAVLTPVAMGMAMPAAAQASTTKALGAPQGKAVSLHPVRATMRPDNGCTGTNEFHIPTSPNPRTRGHGWETRHNQGSVCVGTVVFSTYFTKNFCKSASTWIRSVQGTRIWYGIRLCGTNGHWTASSIGFHSLIQGANAVVVSVCVGSEYDGGKVNCTGV